MTSIIISKHVFQRILIRNTTTVIHEVSKLVLSNPLAMVFQLKIVDTALSYNGSSFYFEFMVDRRTNKIAWNRTFSFYGALNDEIVPSYGNNLFRLTISSGNGGSSVFQFSIVII